MVNLLTRVSYCLLPRSDIARVIRSIWLDPSHLHGAYVAYAPPHAPAACDDGRPSFSFGEVDAINVGGPAGEDAAVHVRGGCWVHVGCVIDFTEPIERWPGPWYDAVWLAILDLALKRHRMHQMHQMHGSYPPASPPSVAAVAAVADKLDLHATITRLRALRSLPRIDKELWDHLCTLPDDDFIARGAATMSQSFHPNADAESWSV